MIVQRTSEGLTKEQSAEKSDRISSSSFVDEEVARAVLVGLSHFGPRSIVESLVYILELEHSVDIRAIALNLDSLRNALSKMFGGAAYVVETKICQALAKRLGVDSEGRSLENLISTLKSMSVDEVTAK